MEASIPAVTPAPIPPAATSTQATPASDETAPFSDFLAAAENAGNDNQEEKDFADAEDSTPLSSQQEVMAAELTALSFQSMPAIDVRQPLTGQEMPTILTDRTDITSPVIPDLDVLQQSKAMSAETGQMIAPPTAQIATDLLPMTGEKLFTASPSQDASLLTQQIQSIPSQDEPLLTQQIQSIPSQDEPLLTQQIQSILDNDPLATITIQAPAQTAQTKPAESLNGLTSPYLQSDATSTLTTPPVTMADDGAVDPKIQPDTIESLRENLEKHSLDTRIESPPEKNSAGNQQQGTGQQENNGQQQNTLNTPPAISHSTSDPTSQFIVTGLGTQTAATTPGHTSVAQPATLPPGAPIPAEEIVNHLVDRFSVNPRLQTSKVSLNLNPAELGAIKIDIIVKGDSIKAHIAAGNQKIQETIEKHMPKLRTVLEQQGFTIEDFQVTQESSTTDSNDFFQQQFSSRQDTAPQAAPVLDKSSFELSLHSAEALLSGPMDSGINLSI
jgi:flagellar hook-length control protein FliK